MKTLIVYYTKTNTTKEIAERIAEKLISKGHDVDIMLVDENIDLGMYENVVIGAPINGMRMVPEFQKFIDENYVLLQAKNVSIFAVSYLIRIGRMMWQKAIRRAVKNYETISSNIKIFQGRIDKPFSAFPRFMFGVKKSTPTDLREWSVIDKWIDTL